MSLDVAAKRERHRLEAARSRARARGEDVPLMRKGPPREPVLDRIVRFIDATGDCWDWTGARSRRGYGLMSVRPGGNRNAHRVVWETLVGPIPDGLQLDHLCRNRACVNPAHLEPVTNRENARRSPLMGGARVRGSGRCSV